MYSGNLKFDANFSLSSPDPRPSRDPTSWPSKSEKKKRERLYSS